MSPSFPDSQCQSVNGVLVKVKWAICFILFYFTNDSQSLIVRSIFAHVKFGLRGNLLKLIVAIKKIR